MVGTKHPHTTNKHYHFRSIEAQQLRPVKHQLFGTNCVDFFLPITKSIGQGLKVAKAVSVSLFFGCIATAFLKWDLNNMATGLDCLLKPNIPSQNNYIC